MGRRHRRHRCGRSRSARSTTARSAGPNAPKISHKKNWGPASKGVARAVLRHQRPDPGRSHRTLRLVCHLRTADGQEHEYGVDSPLLGYSYYGEVLLDWIVERLANQKGSPDTPLGGRRRADGGLRHPREGAHRYRRHALHANWVSRRTCSPATRPSSGSTTPRAMRPPNCARRSRARLAMSARARSTWVADGQIRDPSSGVSRSSRWAARQVDRSAGRSAAACTPTGCGRSATSTQRHHRVRPQGASRCWAVRPATRDEPGPDAGPGNAPRGDRHAARRRRTAPVTIRQLDARALGVGRSRGPARRRCRRSTTPACTGCRSAEPWPTSRPRRCAATSASPMPRPLPDTSVFTTKTGAHPGAVRHPAGHLRRPEPGAPDEYHQPGESVGRRRRPTTCAASGRTCWSRVDEVGREFPEAAWVGGDVEVGSVGAARHQPDDQLRGAAPRPQPGLELDRGLTRRLAERTDRFLGVYADVTDSRSGAGR